MNIGLAEGHRIDAVVSDVVMPRLGGLKLLEELRLRSPEIRFLFTSGYPQNLETLPAGVRLLPKPFAMDGEMAGAAMNGFAPLRIS